MSVVSLALAVGAYWALLFVLQRPMMYPAPRLWGATPLPAGVSRVWLELPFGRTEAWFLPALRPAGTSGPLLIFTHGNAELIDYWAEEFDQPRAWGVSVLLVEYPGYGRSEGRPSERSITQAVVAAYDWALTRSDVDPGRIIGYGRSLGAGAVCALARERRLAGLVLESAFTGVRALALRYLVPPFLVRDPFDNASVVRQYPGPLLLLHGEHDNIIPARHSRRLHAIAPGSTLRLLPCGHNDCPRPWAILRQFLDQADLLAPRVARAPKAD